MARKRSSGAPRRSSSKKGKTKAKAPTLFKLARSTFEKLPASERQNASAELWQKSGGKCALCSLPLDLETKDSVVADHRVAEAKDGKTVLSNLYLAHRSCNSSRQHLDFEVAQPLIRFRSVAEQKPVTFDIVIDDYIPEPNRELVTYSESANVVEVLFGHQKVQAPLCVDPATGVKYFFLDVPVRYIHNDTEIQPRVIMPGHVRKLALDFLERPVHEPSNCRLVKKGPETGCLLQFDGQHKTTAQILIGRKTVPMKVYVEPTIDMLQALVIKIQQEIKKQPLTKSDTLAKIGDVVKRILDSYEEKLGTHRSEKGLIAKQPKNEQKEVKKLYFNELRRIIFFDEENRLSKAVGPSVKNRPTTDKVVVDKIITPLMYSQLLDSDMDESGERDTERTNIIFVLNAISDRMLPEGWDKAGNDLQKLRAQNFFYQGSIGWWMGEILEPSLRYVLYALGKNKPLFLKQLEEAEKEKILSLVDKLCAWPIWSTEEVEHLKAMRSNTVRNVVDAFPGFTGKRLLEEMYF
jgi:hypothetical protein